MAELVDALVSNTCGKPCRFDSGSGYKTSSKEGVFLFYLILSKFQDSLNDCVQKNCIAKNNTFEFNFSCFKFKKMLKSKIHKFITQNPIFLKFIYSIIILDVLSVILSSYKEIHNEYETHFNYFELVSIIIFSIEYLIRFWTSDLEYNTGTSLSKRIKFLFSTVGLIDLLAILPFYLPLFFAFDLRVLRILRLFRLLRIFL